MDLPTGTVKKYLIKNAVSWFLPFINEKLVFPIQGNFPNFDLPSTIQAVLHRTEQILHTIDVNKPEQIVLANFVEELDRRDPNLLILFKQILLLYRRDRAAYTEKLTEKTFNIELAQTLESDLKALDAVADQKWFQEIPLVRLPRAKDFLPVQYIESSQVNQIPLSPRQYDEKFHILQAPNLFLPDLAYFRGKCEDRETPLAVAFLDIDRFKQFNTDHGDTNVDRNLLPRFMQTVEAHVFHHGYAYRQGGDEYLILVPSLSRPLAIGFLDELRCKLANLEYPDIQGNTTVSIGLCIVEADCPLTDRELLARANQAKQFAKEHGRNCIATFKGPRFTPDELIVVSPPERTGAAATQSP